MDIASFRIGHELTHAYAILQWMNRNKQQYTNDVLTKMGYTNLTAAMNNTNNTPYYKNEALVGEMLYRMHQLERSAYVAQIRQEIKSMNLTRYDDIWSAIKKTSSWKQYIKTAELVSGLLNIDDEPTQDGIVISINKLTKKTFQNLGRL